MPRPLVDNTGKVTCFIGTYNKRRDRFEWTLTLLDRNKRAYTISKDDFSSIHLLAYFLFNEVIIYKDNTVVKKYKVKRFPRSLDVSMEALNRQWILYNRVINKDGEPVLVIVPEPLS